MLSVLLAIGCGKPTMDSPHKELVMRNVDFVGCRNKPLNTLLSVIYDATTHLWRQILFPPPASKFAIPPVKLLRLEMNVCYVIVVYHWMLRNGNPLAMPFDGGMGCDAFDCHHFVLLLSFVSSYGISITHMPLE